MISSYEMNKNGLSVDQECKLFSVEVEVFQIGTSLMPHSILECATIRFQDH